MANVVRMGVKDVVQHFKQLEDPRSAVNLLHPLESVIVIAIMAVLAGANGPTAIARWANLKAQLLLKVLELPHGIPQKDVFRRVLATLKPDAFQACFTMWLTALHAAAAEATGVERPTLAIDGKTLRRSHDRRRNLGVLHSVSVWASEFGLTLAQVATAEKSNEITAIPTLLSLIDIQGAIITIDAMRTQTAIAEKIIEGGGDYILAVKGNQETLPERQRACVALRYSEGLALCELARRLKRTENAVAAMLYRARISLARCIELALAQGGEP